MISSAVEKSADGAARRQAAAVAWLGAGAITVGIGVALAHGTPTADADSGHSGRSGTAATGDPGPAAPTGHGFGSPKAKVVKPNQASGGVDRTIVSASRTPHAAAVADRRHVMPPPGLPLAHDVLGWVRREVRYTLFNKPPVITPLQHSEDPVTGVVTGDLHGGGAPAGGVAYTVGQPGNAVVRVNPDGTFSVTPDADTAHLGGSVSFSVTADNGRLYRLPGLLGRIQAVIHSYAQRFGVSGPDVTTTVVTVDVAPINKPPTISGYSADMPAADGTVSGRIDASDPNQDILQFVGPATSALGALITIEPDGSFTCAPTAEIRHAAAADNAPDAAKRDSFTVTVNDGYGGSTAQTISVPVSPANANPVGGAVTDLAVDEIIGFVGGTVTGVTDPDLDTLSYSSSPTSVGGGFVDVFGDGSFTYNPTAEQRHLAAALGAPFSVTHDSFTISVSDGHGGSTAITVVVPVPPEADEPPTGVAAG